LLYSRRVMARRSRPTVACPAVVLALVAVGCGSSGTSSSSSAGRTSAAESAKSTQSLQTAPQLPTAASSSKGAGFGVTEAAWTAAHIPDNDFTTGSAYDRDPSLGQVEGHAAARYTDVSREGGRITGYTYHLASAPIAAAKRDVLASQFPPDARQVAFAVKPTCAAMIVQSATLRRLLSPVVGHPAEGTSVVFRSGPEEISYDAGAVTSALLSPTASKNPADVVC
jgi:hypothetical protein